MKSKIVLAAVVILLGAFVMNVFAQTDSCNRAETKAELQKVIYDFLTNGNDIPADIGIDNIKSLITLYNAAGNVSSFDCPNQGAVMQKMKERALSPPTCSDGTEYGQCSSTLPKYCYKGGLVNRCRFCGCPGDEICDVNYVDTTKGNYGQWGRCSGDAPITCGSEAVELPIDDVELNYSNRECCVGSGDFTFGGGNYLLYTDPKVEYNGQVYDYFINYTDDGTWCNKSGTIDYGAFNAPSGPLSEEGCYVYGSIRKFYLVNGAYKPASYGRCDNVDNLPCVEDWTCTSWSACSNDVQTRTCTDSYNCGTTDNKPDVSKSCGAIEVIELTASFEGDQFMSSVRGVHNGFDTPVSIYNNKMVWVDYGYSDDPEIVLYDMSTQQRTRITDNSAWQLSASIYGDKIVWWDYRDVVDNDYNWNIYMYTISTGQTIRITTDPDRQVTPMIDGDIILWGDDRSGSYEPYIYDLSTGQESSVPFDLNSMDVAQIEGNKIVVNSLDSCGYDPIFREPIICYQIWLYDLTTEEVKRISPDIPVNGEHYHVNPDISGNKVVWQGYTDVVNGYDIYLYDLITEEITMVTNDGGTNFQARPSIHGDRVVFQDDRNGNWDIYMYEISTGETTQISDSSLDEGGPVVYEDIIAWNVDMISDPDSDEEAYEIYMVDLS